MNRSVTHRKSEVDRFLFRDLHPLVFFGTASDRYGGWVGTVYSEIWNEKARERKKKINGETVLEKVLPVESVEEYFEHFSVLEIDFTFYKTLRDPDGRPSSNYFALAEYARLAPANARFLVKAPQEFFARKLRRSRSTGVVYEDNPGYLDVEGVDYRFLQPLQELLGNRVSGILFQQEYQRAGERHADEHIPELADFFQRIETDYPLHVEIRSAHLQTPVFFDWLQESGIGYAFSHWTWLPSIKEQWFRNNEQFTSADGDVLLRLMNPRDMTYQESLAYAFPFDKPAPELAGLAQTRQMIDEAVALIYQAIRAGKRIHVILNNRAFGSSPYLGQAVAQRFLRFADRFGV